LHFNRLVTIFSVEGHAKAEAVDYKAWLVAIHKGDLLNHAMEGLDIMGARFGWTRSMLTVLSHLCDLGLAECDRTLDLPTTRTLLAALQKDAVEPWLNQTYDAKAVGGRRRAALDGARMEKLCPVEEAKKLVFDSFCDLAIVSEKAHKGTATPEDLDTATVAICGTTSVFLCCAFLGHSCKTWKERCRCSLAHGTYLGRSKEWHVMQRTYGFHAIVAPRTSNVCKPSSAVKRSGTCMQAHSPNVFACLLQAELMPRKTLQMVGQRRAAL
jgi:hypothetical protein